MSVANQDLAVLPQPSKNEPTVCAMRRVRIRELQSWDSLPELKNAWNELLAHSVSGSAAPTWERLRSFWESQAQEHAPKLLFCTDSRGDLIAILPLLRSRERILPGVSAWVLRLIDDCFADSDHFAWILYPGRERAVIWEALNWLERKALEWDILVSNTAPASSAAVSELREQMTSRAWRILDAETLGFVPPLPGVHMACARPFSKGSSALVMAQKAGRAKDWLRSHISEYLRLGH